jgi:hypothetical protein
MALLKSPLFTLLTGVSVGCALAPAQTRMRLPTAHSSKRMADGKQWTTRNLDVNILPSFCYDDAEPNCRKYGRLHTWESARRACQSLGDGGCAIVPWHPLRWTSLQLRGVPLQFGEIVERIGSIEFAGVDQTHKEITHRSPVQRFVRRCDRGRERSFALRSFCVPSMFDSSRVKVPLTT